MPLSASVTDPGNLHEEVAEKNINLVNGDYVYYYALLSCVTYISTIGIALVVGLQVTGHCQYAQVITEPCPKIGSGIL